VPLAGLEIVTEGAVLVAGAATVRVLVRCVTSPPLSVEVAVIVCDPDVSVLVKLPPIPSWPSMLERHTSEDVRLPSCVSLADPENVIEAPDAKLAPLAGLEIVTDGAVLVDPDVTYTMMAFVIVYPMLSVTVALTVWLPTVSAFENEAPVPIWPSMLDRQVR